MQVFIFVLFLIVVISAFGYIMYLHSHHQIAVLKIIPPSTKGSLSENQPQPQPQPQPHLILAPSSVDIAKDQMNTLAYIYAPPTPPPLPYPGYVFPPAGYPYPFSYNAKQLGGGYYYHGDGRRRR